MIENKKPLWLKRFAKTLLATPKYQAAIPRICFLDPVNKKQQLYRDDIINNLQLKKPQDPALAQYYHQLLAQLKAKTPDIPAEAQIQYHLIDLAKHFKSLKYHYLENELYHICHARTQMQPTKLVTDNRFLALINAGYHVVLMDATNDFANNYYPTYNLAANDHKNSYCYFLEDIPWQSKTNYFKYVVQCLAFINDDGSYFLALPCYTPFLAFKFNRKALKEQQAQIASLPMIKTTIKIINKLLKPMKLFRDHEVTALRLYPNNDHDIWPVNSYDYGIYGQEIPHLLTKRDYLDGHGQVKYAYESVIDAFLSLIYYENEDLMFDYLNEQVTLVFKQNGHYLMRTSSKIPFWQKKFNHDFSCLTDTLKYYDQQSIICDHTDLFRQNTVEVTNLIYQLKLVKMPLITMQMTTPQTTSEEIILPQTGQLKPLIKQHKLNQLNLSLQEGTSHQYYCLNNQLITLNGSNKIESEHKVLL